MVAGAVLLAVAALVLPTLAVLRLTRVAARHRRSSLRTLAALDRRLGGLLGVRRRGRLGHGHRVHERGPTSPSTRCTPCSPTSATERVSTRRFDERPLPQHAAGSRLLAGLRGKDVLLVFVESYGKMAVEGTPFSPGIDAVLDAGTRQLAGRRLLGPKRLAHLVDLRRRQLAGARHAPVGYLGRQPGALQRARREQSPHADDGVRARRAGGRSATCRRTTAPGRRARPSTTTTRSTTAGTSAIAARRTRFASMPDQYVLLALQRLELAKRPPPPHLLGDRPGVEPHSRGPASRR